ncbi:alpha-xylosidase [Angustibacter aerolatus]
MRFTDGYWRTRQGFRVLHPAEVEQVEVRGRELVVHSPTAPLRGRGDTLNLPVVTHTIGSPAPGVISVRIEHHAGGVPPRPVFELARGDEHPVQVVVEDDVAWLRTEDLTVRVHRSGPWRLEVLRGERVLTSSDRRSVGLVTETATGRHLVHEQLAIGVGETLHGLGERFGPTVRNGQSVDVWNADGGTSSEQAYKNVPFLLSSSGYGVLVDDPGPVSFEVGSEAVSRTQFSVEGQSLTYLLLDGPTPKDVLRRCTALAGRPARVPAWSLGLWLSTSFTTSYDEETVTSFVDGMAERGIPLSVFHFDCFWMRQFHWCDFVWDPATFPDPRGMLQRLHDKGLRVCVWINPYIAQRSHLFTEGRDRGYLLRRADGSVWQTDDWQAGTALVDFTNPDAVAWWTGELAELLELGVDCFKTDFGERVPTDVVWHDGSDPQRMHNWYAQLYNRAVFDLLERERGAGEAVVFARSATVGGQRMPAHWGGDCESSFAGMAETLRGGLSAAASGFAFWSHDVGGFEGTPDPAVFKRWVPFGLLSSHSRLHGSGSVRVPWAFDEEAVDVLRSFTRLKLELSPYLLAAADEAHREGVPVLRPMLLELPDDPTSALLDRQYLLGPDLLVAPVMSADGDVTYYVPEGTWTHLLTGAEVTGPRWVTERYAFDALPLLVRPGAVLPLAVGALSPELDPDLEIELTVFSPQLDRTQVVRVPDGHGVTALEVEVTVAGGQVSARRLSGTVPYRVELP